jgi:hypothetical protein
MHDSTMNFVSKQVAIHRSVNFYRNWLEQQLAVPLSESIILEVDLDLTQIGAERKVGYADPDALPTRTLRRLRTLVAATEIPGDFPPVLEMICGTAQEDLSEISGGAKPKNTPGFRWNGCPIALRFHFKALVLVALNVSYHDGPGTSYQSMARLIVARQDCASEAIRMLAQIARRDRQPRIRVQDGPVRRIMPSDWQDLVLDESILRLVRDDFERFFAKRSWFKKNHLPFRRGYLLHGPPGNGKSSVVRAMLSRHGLTAHTLRFFDSHKDDSDLERLFDDAHRDRPSIVLLEDVDRVFPMAGNSKSNFSLQALLNCLDGIGSPEGIVVVATANEATNLDPAILKRPGRFDRVVYFPNPGKALRLQFFRKFNPQLDVRALERPATESDGMSYAQLREVIILAAQYAFERDGDVNDGDLLNGVRMLRQTNAQGSTRSKTAGF